MVRCKLCENEIHKPQKSHIIPKFMYKNLRDKKSRILRFQIPSGKTMRPIFDGIWEKPLLCKKCEDLICVWENYSEKILYGHAKIQMPTVSMIKDSPYLNVENIDYNKFKLFLLSIVWRASVSSKNFFSEVNLGIEHEFRIKKLMLSANAGEEDQYPIVIIIPKGPTGKSLSVVQPYKKKVENNVIKYIFPIAESIFIYHISKHGLSELEKNTSIKKDNTMQILYSNKSRTEVLCELYGVRQKDKDRIKNKLF